MNVADALLFGSWFWVAGLACLYAPQTVFRIRHAPMAPSEDGLTEAGEQSYRRLGLFHIALGTLLVGYILTI